MGVFAKHSGWWIDYYVNGRRKRERIGGPLTKAMKKVASDVLAKRKVELAEGKFLDKRHVPRCGFEELARLYLTWAETNHQGFASTRSRVKRFCEVFGSQLLPAITALDIDRYVSDRRASCKPATINRELIVLGHMFTKAIEWAKSRPTRCALSGHYV